MGFGKTNNKKIPIGYEDFKLLIDGGFYYVDKTMLIYDLLSFGGQNNLITRPRRFGKTLNFSMLRYFFDITEKDNAYLFDGTEIMKHKDEVSPYQNAFPVISISLKSAKQGSFDRALFGICMEIREQFIKYSYVLDSDKITEIEKKDYMRILECDTGDEMLFGTALKKLTGALSKYYGQNAVVFIDEYDMPLEDAYLNGYYNEMVTFIRTLFESALKTNPSLQFSVITGSLHVLNESIFSAINNIEVNSIRGGAYSKFFGFTDEEINAILAYYSLDAKKTDLFEWYGGYQFCDCNMYNPWSVLHQIKQWNIDNNRLPESRWTDMTYLDLINIGLTGFGANSIQQFKELLDGKEIYSTIYNSISFNNIKVDSASLLTFMYYIGYLTIAEDTVRDGKPVSLLKIPNREIQGWFNGLIIQADIDEKPEESAAEENPVDSGNPRREQKNDDDGDGDKFSCILG